VQYTSQRVKTHTERAPYKKFIRSCLRSSPAPHALHPHMNVTANETYSDQEIILDHHKYVECTFKECTIVYHGDGPTAADECKFQNCQFDFRTSASSTFNTLRSFFHGGLEEVVVDVLASIVAPNKQTSPLRVMEQDGHTRLMLDLGRVDPNDLGANGQQDP